MGIGWFLAISGAITFISVFSGVFLAYFLGARGDRAIHREEEDAQRDRAKESIANELRNVLNDAEGYLARVAQPHPGVIITLRPFTDAMDSTIGSGTFALIEPELQEQVSYVYVLISQSKEQMRRIRDFDAGIGIAMTNKQGILVDLEGQLADVVSQVRVRIPDLILLLDEPPRQVEGNADNSSDHR